MAPSMRLGRSPELYAVTRTAGRRRRLTRRSIRWSAVPANALTAADAVLFDMDGLLVDSEPLWTIAEVELATSLGGRFDEELKAVIVGTRLDVAVPAILTWYGKDPAPAAVADAMGFLLERMVELFHERLPLMPGALQLVDGVRDLGVPTALVSSSYRVLVDAALDRLGRERFDVTVAGDEVAHGKPAPEPYLTAGKLLGVRPERCVIVEDAMSGVMSGEAAGGTVVAVPHVAPIEATATRPVVTSLAAIQPAWLVQQVLSGDRR